MDLFWLFLVKAQFIKKCLINLTGAQLVDPNLYWLKIIVIEVGPESDPNFFEKICVLWCQKFI